MALVKRGTANTVPFFRPFRSVDDRSSANGNATRTDATNDRSFPWHQPTLFRGRLGRPDPQIIFITRRRNRRKEQKGIRSLLTTDGFRWWLNPCEGQGRTIPCYNIQNFVVDVKTLLKEIETESMVRETPSSAGALGNRPHRGRSEPGHGG